MTIEFSYLHKQFDETEADLIWQRIKPVVTEGRFTLGVEVDRFEEAYARKCGSLHGIGVGSGTDAIALPLMALGIKGTVVAPAFTFFATVGAIVQAGATPKLVDIGPDFNIDPAAIDDAITPDVEAIVPVHWAGRPCNMTKIMEIARRHNLAVIEDAAQGIGAKWDNRSVGSFGIAGAFSLHPLKITQGWTDGGVIVTSNNNLATRLHRLRNHGMVDRNRIEFFGVNSRLSTVNAVVAHHVLEKVDNAIAIRRAFAVRLNRMLAGVPGIEIVPLDSQAFANYYLFTGMAQNRDNLLAYLNAHGVQAKCHYPLTISEQPAAAHLGYKAGQFPMAERAARSTFSLPCHEFLSLADADCMAGLVREFYEMGGARAAE